MRQLPIFFVAFSVSLCHSPPEDGVDRYNRSYRISTLQNGMHVLIIQDKEVNEVAACLGVAVGTMNAPEVPGLPNRLQHLLLQDGGLYPVSASTDLDKTIYGIRSGNTELLENILERTEWVCQIWKGSSEDYSDFFPRRAIHTLYLLQVLSSCSTSRGFHLAVMDFNLTPLGFQHRDDVLTAFFQYIKLLKTIGLQKWFWNGMVTLVNIKWKKKPDKPFKLPALNMAEKYTRLLVAANSSEDVKRYLFDIKEEEFPVKAIKEVVSSYLVPGNMRVVMSSDQIVQPTKEYWPLYDVSYNYAPLDEHVLKVLEDPPDNNGMKLPEPLGLGITTHAADFERLSKTETVSGDPVLILNTSYTVAWMKNENKLRAPTASIRGKISSNPLLPSKNDAILASLFASIIDYYTEMWPLYLSYSSASNGTLLHLSMNQRGREISINVNGLIKPTTTILRTLIHNITSAQDEESFKRVKYLEMKKLFPIDLPTPCLCVQPEVVFKADFEDPRKLSLEKFKTLKALTFEDLQEYRDTFFKEAKMEWWIEGEIKEEEVKELLQDLEKELIYSLSFHSASTSNTMKSTKMSEKLVNLNLDQITNGNRSDNLRIKMPTCTPRSPSSCLLLTYHPEWSQTGKVYDTVMLRVLHQLIKGPFNDQFREKPKGHLVGVALDYDLPSVTFYLEDGDYRDLDKLEQKVRTFLEMFQDKTLKVMNEGDLQTLVQPYGFEIDKSINLEDLISYFKKLVDTSQKAVFFVTQDKKVR